MASRGHARGRTAKSAAAAPAPYNPGPMRSTRALLVAALLGTLALPAVALERHTVLPGERVLGTVNDDAPVHEYLIAVPRSGVLTVALPRQKTSVLQGSLGLFSLAYRVEPALQIAARKIQQRTPPTATTQYRVVVAGANGSQGDYALVPKITPQTLWKIRGKVTDLNPPGRIVFGALAGYEAQLTVSWKGADPVTIGSFTGPGGDVTSSAEPKQKGSTWKQKGYTLSEVGDYTVVLDIPPSAKRWALTVKLKGSANAGLETDRRPEHATPPGLALAATPALLPFVTVVGESGAANDIVLTSQGTAPIAIGIAGPPPDPCTLTPLQAGPTPTGYALACGEDYGATLAVAARDASRRVLDFSADPVFTPAGSGTAAYSDFVFDGSGRPLGWTEVRTFEATGHEHTLVISDIQRLSGGIFTYTVLHTDPDGVTRRYDFLPF